MDSPGVLSKEMVQDFILFKKKNLKCYFYSLRLQGKISQSEDLEDRFALLMHLKCEFRLKKIIIRS